MNAQFTQGIPMMSTISLRAGVGRVLLALSLFTAAAVVHAEPSEFFDLAPVSSSNSAGGAMPSQVSGKLSFSEEDMRVKVMGGFVRLTRDFDGSRWYINSRWTSLAFTAGTGLISDIAGSDAAADAGTTFGGTKIPGTVNPITGDFPGVLTTINRNGAMFYADATGYTFVQPSNRRFTIRPLGINAAAAVGGIAVTTSAGGQPVLPAAITGWRWQSLDGEWIEYDRDGRITKYGDRNNVQVSFQYTAERITAILDHAGNAAMTLHYNAAGQIDEVRDVPRPGDTDPARVVQYQYNAAGSLTKVIDVMTYETVYGYDSKNRLITRKDAENHTRTFAWSANNRISKVTEPDGAVTDYKYEFDRSTKQYRVEVLYPEVEAGRKIVKSWYDTDGRLVEREINGRVDYKLKQDGLSKINVDAAGNETKRTEDEYGHVVKTVYADGATTSAIYSPLHGRVLEETDELGVKTKYEYDSNGNLTKQIEAFGYPEQRTTLWTYDTNGNVLTHTIKGIAGLPGASAEDATTAYAYDDYGNRTTVTDALTHATTYVHNRLGQTTTITDARSKIWQRTYDKRGLMVTRTNPLLQIESYQYDKLGNRTRSTDANGTAWVLTYDDRSRPKTSGVLNAPPEMQAVFAYDAAGRLVRYEKPGQFSLLAYDAEGRLQSSTDKHGSRMQYTYDDAGRVTQEELRSAANALLRQSTRTWDNRNRLTTVTALPHLQQTYTYDAKGRVLTQSDGLGHAQHSVYDALDRVMQVRDPLDAVTALDYDSRDALIRVTDPRGLQTSYQADLGDCLTTLASPDTGTSTSACNALGQQITATDARGVVQTFSRDDLGRVTAIQYSDAPGEAVTYGYDDTAGSNAGVGRLTSASNAVATITRRYNAHGYLAEDSRVFGGQTYTTAYEHDSAGQLQEMIYPSGRRVIYQRNEAGEVTEVLTQAASGGTETVLTNVVWTADSQLQQLEYGNGLTEMRSYGQDGYLTQIAITGSEGNLLTRSYARDTAGRITGITDGQAPRSETYGYDNADRLTTASGPYGTRSYTYDGVGNRLTQDEGGAASSYTYGSTSNRLMQITGADAASVDYDAVGNTTEKGDTTFVYNAANRLVSITVPGSPATTLDFAYTALGERFSKTGPNGTTHFHYDQQGHLIAESDASGNVIREYLWLQDVPVGLVATRTGSVDPELFAVHTDHLATTLAITDGGQNAVWQSTREPFGQLASITASIDWPLRFPGQYEDGETALFYNYFRDYDAAMGRYIESDPIGLLGGVNTFAYAGNSPILQTDALGLSPTSILVSGLRYGAAAALGRSVIFVGVGTMGYISLPDSDEEAGEESCSDDEDPCAEIFRRIDAVVAELKKRYSDLINDKNNLPATGKNSISGHQQQFENKQENLRDLIRQAEKMGCLAYNRNAWYWATVEVPFPQWGGGMP